MKSLLNDELIDFLNESHNEYLAADKIRSLLLDNSFLELKENEVWNLKANQKYLLLLLHQFLNQVIFIIRLYPHI